MRIKLIKERELMCLFTKVNTAYNKLYHKYCEERNKGLKSNYQIFYYIERDNWIENFNNMSSPKYQKKYLLRMHEIFTILLNEKPTKFNKKESEIKFNKK